MNEIKKCPFCGMNAYAETTVCFGSVRTVIGCVHCGVECEKDTRIKQEENLIKTMNKTFESVLNAWNKRAEEPQEHKESNIEWSLNEIKKGTFFYNVCNLAHLTKWYVPCVEEDCGECEFRDKKHAINYLLAPHED